jgi:hypothetical protein
MMPYGLGLYLDGILHAVAACIHLLDESMHLFCRHPQGLDPPHLAANNAVVAFRLIDGHDGILRSILAVAVFKVEQRSVIKTIANRPLMVDHGLYQVVFAFYFLKGEYAVWMNQSCHLLSFRFSELVLAIRDLSSFSRQARSGLEMDGQRIAFQIKA